jgi:hypothetical protein
VDGVPMVSPGPGAALVLANTTTKPLTGSSNDLSFPTTGRRPDFCLESACSALSPLKMHEASFF